VKQSPGAAYLMLFLAALFWLGMLVYGSHPLSSEDFIGVLEVTFGAYCALALWLMLIGLTTLTAVDRSSPLRTRLGAPLVFVLSAACVLGSTGLGASGGPVVVALFPLLVALYAFWPHPWVAAAVVLLSAVLLVLIATDVIPSHERGEKITAVVSQRAARDRAGYGRLGPKQIEAFGRLGPDSRMDDYLRFLFNSDLAGEAREGIRRVKSRQADTVTLLRTDHLFSLADLHDFDVAVTPEVCAAYTAALDKEARKIDPKGWRYYSGRELVDVEAQRANLRWLVGEGCDLRTSLTRLEKYVRAVADIPFVTSFADELATLRSK
jgi:hypothetical protein